MAHSLWPKEFLAFEDFVVVLTEIMTHAKFELSDHEKELSVCQKRQAVYEKKLSAIELGKKKKELEYYKDVIINLKRDLSKDVTLKETIQHYIGQYEDEVKRLEKDIDESDKIVAEDFHLKIKELKSTISKEKHIVAHEDMLKSKLQSVDTWFSYVEMEHHGWNVAFSALGLSNVLEEKINVESKILVDCETFVDDSFPLILRRMKELPFNEGDQRVLLFDEIKLNTVSFDQMKKFFSLSGIYVVKLRDFM